MFWFSAFASRNFSALSRRRFSLFHYFLLHLKYQLITGLSEESASSNTDFNLNLSICSKGYLLRPITLLNKCRFRMKSYSPVFILIAEHLTEAVMIAPFSGQLKYPISYCNIYIEVYK